MMQINENERLARKEHTKSTCLIFTVQVKKNKKTNKQKMKFPSILIVDQAQIQLRNTSSLLLRFERCN